jgi:F420-dependent oxidoreductase-like protein
VVASDKRSPARDSELALKLGLNLGYWGLGAPVTEQLELVLEAERLGFDSVWTAEAYGSDAATPLAWLAAQTSTIGLGSAIFQIPGRSAGMTAMTAATLDHLSGGRFRLGLGTSGPQVSEGWHGVRFGRQLARTREYVDVVRMALRRERVRYDGKTLTLPLPHGPGKALKLTIGPVQERIPIYIAAIGPKNTALTAEIADGWLPIMISPEHMDEFRPSLEEGFAAGGRDGSDFDIAPTVTVRIDEDADAARDVMRHYLALYVGGMGSREKNFYNALVQSYGFGDAARQVQDLYLDGKKDEAAAALPASLIDSVALCGPADRVRERLAIYRDAGVGTLILSPMAWTLEDRVAQLRQVAELAAAAA